MSPGADVHDGTLYIFLSFPLVDETMMYVISESKSLPGWEELIDNEKIRIRDFRVEASQG